MSIGSLASSVGGGAKTPVRSLLRIVSQATTLTAPADGYYDFWAVGASGSGAKNVTRATGSGAGGNVRKRVKVKAGDSFVVLLGAGAPTNSAGTDGTAGGDTTVTGPGCSIVAGGGGGGKTLASGLVPGGLGGSASGGDLNFQGGRGGAIASGSNGFTAGGAVNVFGLTDQTGTRGGDVLAGGGTGYTGGGGVGGTGGDSAASASAGGGSGGSASGATAGVNSLGLLSTSSSVFLPADAQVSFGLDYFGGGGSGAAGGPGGGGAGFSSYIGGLFGGSGSGAPSNPGGAGGMFGGGAGAGNGGVGGGAGTNGVLFVAFSTAGV
jgi:hypothetical protein